ncbi:MAG: translation initiation factor IF-3 [Proteobacteria bacterium]|nr:translation initiation factor IF-3 [Pseudomonadota bacterium]
MRAPPTVQKDGPRMNEDIRVREVRLIDKTGNRGTVPIAEALEIAKEQGLDLVEIDPNSDPPVCKTLDYGKFKYQEQKKAAEARKKQKVVEISWSWRRADGGAVATRAQTTCLRGIAKCCGSLICRILPFSKNLFEHRVSGRNSGYGCCAGARSPANG